DNRHGLRLLEPIHGFHMNHGHPPVGIAFRAGLHAGLAADAPVRIHVEGQFGWDWHAVLPLPIAAVPARRRNRAPFRPWPAEPRRPCIPESWKSDPGPRRSTG